jgi:hypothetical protein
MLSMGLAPYTLLALLSENKKRLREWEDTAVLCQLGGEEGLTHRHKIHRLLTRTAICPLPCRLQRIYHGQPYSMPDATLTLCQSRLSPPFKDLGFSFRRTLWTASCTFVACTSTLSSLLYFQLSQRIGSLVLLVNRVPGFLSSHPNWVPPTPSPVRECCSPPLGSRGGTHSPGGGGGGTQFRRWGRHSGTLDIL